MAGNTWITIGVIAAALAAFAIPYGFYKKSNEHSVKNFPSPCLVKYVLDT